MSSRARFVAAGVLASRLAGFVRTKAFAYFFGLDPRADVWATALRTPNLLQNLLGDQALSAAFIPIYARFLEEGRKEDAKRFAGAIFSLLVALVFVVVTLGIMAAPFLIALFTPGYLADAAKVADGTMTVDRYPLAVTAARIIFPMTGVLVLAAWAQGVLNSHRRFFLPYVAPVLWNAAIITALVGVVGFSPVDIMEPGTATANQLDRWLFAAAIGATIGGFFQFGVQLPAVLKLLGGIKLSWSLATTGVRDALKAFGPALAGRGVMQFSAYIDLVLASLIGAGALAAINWAAQLYALPVSVFAIAVVATELPELSRRATEEAEEAAARVDRAVRQIAFVLAPACVGYLAFGYLVVALLLRGGQFGEPGNQLVAAVLAGYTLALFPTAISRLLQNTFFALRDTKTPARIAVARVSTSATLGAAAMFWLDTIQVANSPLRYGAVGLALGTAVGAWVELVLLRRKLWHVLPVLRLHIKPVLEKFGLALLCAVPAAAIWWWLAERSPILTALAVLPVFGGLYLGIAWRLRMPELDMWLGRVGKS